MAMKGDLVTALTAALEALGVQLDFHQAKRHHGWKPAGYVKGQALARCACGAERLRQATRVTNHQRIRMMYRAPGGEWAPSKPPHVEAAA